MIRHIGNEPLTSHTRMQGVDVVWETVGGTMFDTCARNLAVGGRLLVIGMMSQYGEGWPASQVRPQPAHELHA